MWLAMFFVFLEGTFAMTFLPIFLQHDLKLTFHQAEYWTGIMMALPSMAMFLVQPLWGMYADRHGRKPIVIISVAGTSLLRAMWAFAHSPVTLLLLGTAAGIVGSGVIAGQAIVASEAPKDRMGQSMGALQTSLTVGFLIGPVVGQACASAFGPRPTFLLQALFALIGAITVWTMVPEHFVKPERIEKTTLLAALTRDLRPLVGNRQLQALWVMAFVVFFGFSSMWPVITYFVQYIGIPMDRVPAYAAYIMLVTGSLQTVTAPYLGRLGDRIGQKKVLVGTTALCGLALIPHYFVKTYLQFFALRICATAPGSGINPTTAALVARTMPRSRYGGAYGVLASARSLAASVGPLIGGSLAAFVGIRWVFAWTGALLLVSSLWATRAVQEPEG
jgi:DHA1 family multidrug resistance protein-like MFS transporter